MTREKQNTGRVGTASSPSIPRKTDHRHVNIILTCTLAARSGNTWDSVEKALIRKINWAPFTVKGWHASGTAAEKLSQVHQDANEIGIEPTMTETRL